MGNLNISKLSKVYLLIICAFLFLGSNINASQVGTRIDLGETAINLFLNEQYNQAGFKKRITGSVSGVNYDITLQLPYVRLFDNQIKIYFGFKITSNVYNGNIEFEDNLSISVASVENLTVRGVSDAFRDKVNGLGINSILKSVIISAWDSLQLEVYPLLLAEKSNESIWFAERSISIVDPIFSIGYKCLKGKLQVTLNTYLEANEYYNAGLFLDRYVYYLHISCGSQVEVKEVKVYSTGGQLIQEAKNAGTCPKKGVLKIPFANVQGSGYCLVSVLYKTNDTFYVRNYKCLLNVNTYVKPSKSIN